MFVHFFVDVFFYSTPEMFLPITSRAKKNMYNKQGHTSKPMTRGSGLLFLYPQYQDLTVSLANM